MIIASKVNLIYKMKNQIIRLSKTLPEEYNELQKQYNELENRFINCSRYKFNYICIYFNIHGE